MKKIKFAPTIYEHCAALIGRTTEEVALNENLLVEGQLKAYELYGQDLIYVGVDIYDVESEAIKVPGVVPNPLSAGRMPMFLSACKRIQSCVPVPVSGTVIGPFTLATKLRGFENLIMDMIEDPAYAHKQIEYARKVGLQYAKAFHDIGVGVAINESWIAPPLLSPDLYNTFAFPAEKQMISELKEYGLSSIALISGGDTTTIIDKIVDTGTSLIMADWKCDRKKYKEICRNHNCILRASIDPVVLRDGDAARMRDDVDTVLNDCADYDKFIFGCGIVSYDTDPKNVIKLKNILQELSYEKN